MIALQSIGMIGGGQMGEALIRGLIESGLSEAASITVAEPAVTRREYLETTYQVKTTESAAELAGTSKIIILAIKPQIMEPVLALYREHLNARHLLISIAAGVTISQMERCLGEKMRIIRVMPNTPALVLAGASAMSGNKNASREDMALCGQIFSAVGTCVEVPENLLDAVTGLSGSGPGYVFTFLEALIDGGVLAGIPRPLAEQLALQTLFGSAKLAMETGEPAAVLKGRVTSPGGTTIAGLQVMERDGLRGTVMAAVKAATDRSKELGK
ncbi:MAG: pyrroline-5-carboxylate reductase [Candidatus Electronema aureum]|uniref:Pyrroline-5-carboxylate reductase n=1 Tax=Candidatus Electronema aureum TaxID=2005002 RepID=A0A521G014_9BACT|nr:MAG: pyrroline-5-carboxylate reductase [Candidatus Electronema aureum]